MRFQSHSYELIAQLIGGIRPFCDLNNIIKRVNTQLKCFCALNYYSDNRLLYYITDWAKQSLCFDLNVQHYFVCVCTCPSVCLSLLLTTTAKRLDQFCHDILHACSLFLGQAMYACIRFVSIVHCYLIQNCKRGRTYSLSVSLFSKVS